MTSKTVDFNSFKTEGHYKYQIIDGFAKIIKYDGDEENLLIPGVLGSIVVTVIGESAFEYCNSIINVTIPDSIKIIEDYAFKYSSSIKDVKIPDSVEEVGHYAFYYGDIEQVFIPKNVVKIGQDAFGSAEFFVNSENPNYSSDEKGVFFNKDKSELIRYPKNGDDKYEIPTTVTKIANEAFASCNTPMRITIPDSVRTIGECAFAFSNILSISIPNTVKKIEDGMFLESVGLKHVTLPDGVTSIGSGVFKSYGMLSIVIPSSVKEFGLINFALGEGLVFIVERGSVAEAYTKRLKGQVLIKDVDCTLDEYGVLFNKDKTKLINYPNIEGKNYEISSSVTTIGKNAFSHNCTLESLVCAEGLTVIEERAFENCSLKKVQFPRSLKIIEDRAFLFCSDLKEVVFLDDLDKIGNDAFEFNKGLQKLNGNDTDLGTIYGIKGSVAETYAVENDIQFRELG